MRPRDAAETAAKIMQAGIVPFFEGDPGIGKSAITLVIEEILRKNWHKDIRRMDFVVPQRDLTDISGVPHVEGRLTYWNPPAEFFPEYPLLINFEEVTKGTPTMFNCLCNLILERQAGGRKLHPKTVFYMSGNKTKNRAGDLRIPSHFANRVCFFSMEPNKDDWIDWAIKHNINPWIISFIEYRPELLHKFNPDNFSNPTPRSWERVSWVVEIGLAAFNELEAIQGLVGEGAGVEFTQYKAVASELPDLDLCINSPKEAPIPGKDKMAARYAVTTALVFRATEKTLENIIIYIGRLPKEFQVLFIKLALRGRPELSETPAVTKWMAKVASTLLQE